MAALSWIELTNIVLSGLPDQFTTELETKPLPLTVIRKYGPPASITVFETLVMAGEAAAATPASQKRTAMRP